MKANKTGVSVVICCYNSSARLPKTLEYLSKQEVSSNIDWEIIIVDNNSTDGTSEKALKIWSGLSSEKKLRIELEDKPGLVHAREKGIESSKYEYVLYCDDDNWLSENYVQEAFTTLERDENIAACGGWGKAVADIELPEWFEIFQRNYAVGKTVSEHGYLKNNGEYLFGAGLALRKSSLQKLKDKRYSFKLTDRKGDKLSSGGDLEMIYCLQLIGYKAFFNESMFFYHYMPTERLNFNYLKKLRVSMRPANFVLITYRDALRESYFSKKRMVRYMLIVIPKRLNRAVKAYLAAKGYRKILYLNNIYIPLYFYAKSFTYYKLRKEMQGIKSSEIK